MSTDVGQRLLEDDLVFVDDELVERFSRSVAARGDLIFTCWGTINQVGLVDGRSKYEKYLVSNKQMKLTPDTTIVLPLFLYYFFSSPAGQSQIAMNAHGSSVPGFNLSKLKGIRVPTPPLAEQEYIVGVLGSLDDKIELNRRMNETLEAMAQAIFRDWFIDFGPTRRKLEGATNPVTIMGGLVTDPTRAKELADLFPATLGDDGLPEGWSERAFTSFIDIVGGGTPKTSVADYWGGTIPWFSVVDTPPPGAVFALDTEKSVTERGVQESSARIVRAGTTIISARGTVGNLAVTPQPMTFNQSCYGLQGRDGVGDWFVFLASQHVVERLNGMAHGSVFSTITRQTFDGVSLCYPSAKALAAFEATADVLFEKIKANGYEGRTLVATRDLLLPKLMSGEIRLGDTEELVETLQ